jgi:hypothetical protein
MNDKNGTVPNQNKPRIAIFSSKKWVVDSFNEMNKNYEYELNFFESRMYEKTFSSKI